MEHYNRKTASDVEKKRIAWDEKPSGDNAWEVLKFEFEFWKK